jgi:uncharacterized protein YdiU (UPF0061 family)
MYEVYEFAALNKIKLKQWYTYKQVMTSPKRKLKKEVSTTSYNKFKKLDGSHSLRTVDETCYVDYQARTRHGGKVVVFNYALAKEIGLINKSHDNEMNKDLEKAIIDTFGILIINEFDIENNKKFPKEDIRKGRYMATRYLQLQHPNKQGKTSGDGRSIWNGEIKSSGRRWDITSCGTGATILSPATHIHGKLFETGDPSISYGCGYAEVDEGIETLIFSEILNLNEMATERVLAIIRFPDGYGITVRAHDNLLRPSHFFNHLKQNNLPTLTSLVDYYIDRQEKNKFWKAPKKEASYDYFLEKQIEVFAQLAATFEDEYIFCWMDWDGDNILMDGGIIDYGSVRQFGLFHSEYRFDDDDRFSTSILEQKKKAKYTVQCFIQLIDYIKTGDKKPLDSFKSDIHLKNFDEEFQNQKRKNILKKIGLPLKCHKSIIDSNSDLIDEFITQFSYFEKAKSVTGMRKVNDGISWDAIFCMRDILRELPQLLLARGESITSEEFVEIVKSNYAKKDDLVLADYRKKKIELFQNNYRKIINEATTFLRKSENAVLLEVTMRSSIINRFDRVTGDSISTIREILMRDIHKIKPDKLYDLIENFSRYQNLNPDERKTEKVKKKNSKLMKGFVDIVREYREGI